jgi:hypothetical protein
VAAQYLNCLAVLCKQTVFTTSPLRPVSKGCITFLHVAFNVRGELYTHVVECVTQICLTLRSRL